MPLGNPHPYDRTNRIELREIEDIVYEKLNKEISPLVIRKVTRGILKEVIIQIASGKRVTLHSLGKFKLKIISGCAGVTGKYKSPKINFKTSRALQKRLIQKAKDENLI